VLKDKGKTRQEAVKSLLHQQANEGLTSLDTPSCNGAFAAEALEQHHQAKPLLPINGKRRSGDTMSDFLKG
jgi:hypothetical protein